MSEHAANEEVHYRLMRLPEHESRLSQRNITRRLDIGLGKAEHCLLAHAAAAREDVFMLNAFVEHVAFSGENESFKLRRRP